MCSYLMKERERHGGRPLYRDHQICFTVLGFEPANTDLGVATLIYLPYDDVIGETEASYWTVEMLGKHQMDFITLEGDSVKE